MLSWSRACMPRVVRHCKQMRVACGSLLAALPRQLPLYDCPSVSCFFSAASPHPCPASAPAPVTPCLQDLGGGSMGVRDLDPVPQSAPSLVSPHGDARQPLFRDVVPPPEIMSSEPTKAKAGSGGVAGSQQRDVLGSGSGFPGQSLGSGSGSGSGR